MVMKLIMLMMLMTIRWPRLYSSVFVFMYKGRHSGDVTAAVTDCVPWVGGRGKWGKRWVGE